MTRHAFCETDDLGEGDRILKTVGNREIAVFQVGGEYIAVANYCVHAAGPVCEGSLGGTITADPDDPYSLDWDRENEILSCPWHGWEFAVLSGAYLSDDRFSLLTYDVEVEDGRIYVVTGDTGADEGAATTGADERTAD